MNSIFSGKKILITGHTGFKGAWLTQCLLDWGADICGISIDVPTNPSLFTVLNFGSAIQDIRGDIRDIQALREVFAKVKPEFVFHLAAQPLVRLSYDEPKTTFDTNVGGTVNVLECIRTSETVKVGVIVATDKCYENIESQTGYKETDRLGGADPYSASKAAAEIAFISYQKSFFSKMPDKRVASARAGNVVGGGDWALDRLIPDCVRAWSENDIVHVRNPRSIRPWQHVLEPLSGYLQLAVHLYKNTPGVAGQSFNFGPQEHNQKNVQDVITSAHRHWPGSQWAAHKNSAPQRKEAEILMLNCEKAQNILNWVPHLDFEMTISNTIEWYRSFYQEPQLAKNLTKKQIHDYPFNLG